MKPMIKYWLVEDDKNHLIAVTKNSIYTGSIKKYNKSELINDIEKGVITEEIFNIPFSYIKSVESPKGESIIMINYGADSIEGIELENLKVKDEFFDCLKNEIPKFNYTIKLPSVVKHTKNQLFAIFIVTGLFIWTFYLADQIAKGFEYEVVGGRQGISGLILGFAQFGTTKIILGYLIILTIALFAFIKKLRNRVPIEYLIRIKS